MPRKRNHVRVDEHGFVQHDVGAPWNPPREDARRGLPWSPAEDAVLLRRVRELADDPTVDDPAHVIAKELQRGSCAVMTRLSSLRAGLRLAALSNLKENR